LSKLKIDKHLSEIIQSYVDEAADANNQTLFDHRDAKLRALFYRNVLKDYHVSNIGNFYSNIVTHVENWTIIPSLGNTSDNKAEEFATEALNELVWSPGHRRNLAVGSGIESLTGEYKHRSWQDVQSQNLEKMLEARDTLAGIELVMGVGVALMKKEGDRKDYLLVMQMIIPVPSIYYNSL
jgi:hypothetical protein